MGTNEIKILFFGDITGKIGRRAVKDYLADLRENNNFPDFVIANGENASHGFGLTEKNYNELINAGINCITSGNHIWDKKDIFSYIDNADKLLRPINYPQGTLGKGSEIFEINGLKIGVINALGRVFTMPVDSPWTVVKAEVERMKEVTENIIIDFHAEATAEKVCFGRYMSELGVSVLAGTHTHIQTADECIINGMAYITDAGSCGSVNSVIGMEYETSLQRLTTLLPERYEIAETYPAHINALEATLKDGRAVSVKRINVITNESKSEADIDGDI